MSKIRKILEKTSESVHPMICLLFESDKVIPGKQTTKHYKKLVEC